MKYARSSQSGNVLFIILIACALFGALSYAVSNMMRSNNPNQIGEQKGEVFATEILDYGRAVRQGVQAVLINGCDVTDVSFANNIVSGYAHGSADTCKIFNPSGGGVNYMAPLDDWLADVSGPPALQGTWYFPADVCVPDIGTGSSGCDSDGTDNEDLVMILPYIKSEICNKINKLVSGSNSTLAGSGDEWPDAGTKFTGSFSDGVALDQDGRMAGCFAGDGGADTPASGTYHFFQVLSAR